MHSTNNAQRKTPQAPTPNVSAIHVPVSSPLRAAAEQFIQITFAAKYAAHVSTFAPQLMVITQAQSLIAAAGWRQAQAEHLFLERYLDAPIEQSMAKLAHQRVERERIVEVGHLTSQKAGGSVHIVRALASHFAAQGYEWVVFTATRELIGIFAKLGLPLLALAAADPARLGDEAAQWGRYYETEPIVVAGKIRLALAPLGPCT